MGAVRKADFYFGSMLSCLINNGLAPAIIEPGDSRRIYKLSTDNGDYQLYAKYVSSPSRRQKKDAQLWQFIFSPDEVKYIRNYQDNGQKLPESVIKTRSKLPRKLDQSTKYCTRGSSPNR